MPYIYLNGIHINVSDKAVAHRKLFEKRGGKLFKKIAPTPAEILAQLLQNKTALCVALPDEEENPRYWTVAKVVAGCIGPNGVPDVSYVRATPEEEAAYAAAEKALTDKAAAAKAAYTARQEAARLRRLNADIKRAEKLLLKHGATVSNLPQPK